MVKPQTLKGFRDFLPKEAKKRQFVINTLKQVFESYGFEPLETPALEYEEILLGKYGEEGDRLMYRFVDNGKRKVALRYDQTVPLARVVAQYQNELPMPFKRYQVQNVWRAENTQKGRFREFLQCDIDTVGLGSLYADAEIIACTLTVIKKLGFKNFCMNINDREIFAGVETKYMIIIDKLPKIGEEAVIQELSRYMSKDEAKKVLIDLLASAKTDRLIKIFSILKSSGFEENKDFKFNPTLVRGLDYYTGVIFELTISDYGDDKSVAGGGRYDKLIGMFAGKQIAAVGIAFGFDRLMEAMEELNLFPQSVNESSTKALITIFSKELMQKSLDISTALSSAGVSTELYLDESTKMEKQLKYADQKGIPYVVIIGPQEAEKNMVTLKNMKTREQVTIPSKGVPEKIKAD